MGLKLQGIWQKGLDTVMNVRVFLEPGFAPFDDSIADAWPPLWICLNVDRDIPDGFYWGLKGAFCNKVEFFVHKKNDTLFLI